MTKSSFPLRWSRHPKVSIIGLALVLGAATMLSAQDKPKTAAGKTPDDTTKGAEWRSLFDGKTLTGWKITDFAGGGEVAVEPKFQGANDVLSLGMGSTLTGLTRTNKDIPKLDYEVTLEGMKVDGNDFWCGLTFPVADSWATLVLGGWGGATVGISCVNGNDASENDTTKFMNFEKKRWYKVRLRVTKTNISTWIDGEKIIDQDITDKKISLRYGEIEESKPFGIASYQTTAVIRDFKIRKLAKP